MAMLAPAIAGVHSSTMPNLPTSAPVLEFVCLFTHDLKRKQKRWQDGRLKYHTFNKRVMVHDERGNFIGDVHWTADYDLEEGEELQLERGGVIVQVSECVGRRDQDLTELLDKRVKEVEQRQAAAILRTSGNSSNPAQQAAHFQLRHRPLHSLISTPAAPLGRAVLPSKSPFESRQADSAAAPDQSSRPSKRRKYDVSPLSKGGYAQNLFGATLTLSARPASSQSVRKNLLNLGAQQKELVHVSSSPPHPDRNGPRAERGSDDYERLSLPNNGKGTAVDAVPVRPVPVSENPKRKQRHGQGAVSSSHGRGGETGTPELVAARSQALPRLDNFDAQDVRKSHFSRQQQPRSTSTEKPPETSKQVAMELGKEPELITTQPAEGPKTELRIKPRKKRGLLMVAEKSTSRGAESLGGDVVELHMAQPAVTARNQSRRDKRRRSGLAAVPGVGDRPVQTNIRISPACEDIDATLEAETRLGGSHENKHDEQPALVPDLTSKVRQNIRTTGPRKGRHEVSVPTRSVGNKASIKAIRQAPEPSSPHLSGGQQSERAIWPPGPRLASFGRKNIRSKEIIGFVRDPERSRSENIAPAQVSFGNLQQDSPATARPTVQPPKRQNPATRGRKAAVKSDAAGKTPQSIVPANPEPGRVEISLEVRELPGFSRAGGGPWSREAYDLLGVPRPI
jgi:hypothetical protein